jgi:uncharacterized membrane protein YgaE (UPF0421/DUF939 family)
MGIIQFNKTQYLSHLIYLVKCITGLVVCYILYVQFPKFPFYWSIVSVVLAMSPDTSNNQAFDRIKANLLGCTIGIGLYALQLPELLMLCLGTALTIGLGITFKITNTLRSALAALIIVTIQSEQTKHWYTALERVIFVFTGCLIALLITLFFNQVIIRRFKLKLPKT